MYAVPFSMVSASKTIIPYNAHIYNIMEDTSDSKFHRHAPFGRYSVHLCPRDKLASALVAGLLQYITEQGAVYT